MPNVHHPEVMRSILQGIVETGDVIGMAGPGQAVLAVTVGNWLLDPAPVSPSSMLRRGAKKRGEGWQIPLRAITPFQLRSPTGDGGTEPTSWPTAGGWWAPAAAAQREPDSAPAPTAMP